MLSAVLLCPGIATPPLSNGVRGGGGVPAVAGSSVPRVAPQPTPSEWHRARRQAILEAHPDVQSLIVKEKSTLPLLAVANLAQIGACVAGSHLPGYELVPAAVLVGGTLSLWQFALLHDVKHGTAVLPKGVRINDVVFWGSLPSLFGYYLYLRWGHLSHHTNFGEKRITELFDSAQDKFEDGDVMFVAHRQLLLGDERSERPGFFGGEQVGGLGLSISRTIYAWLWSDREGSAWYNALVYAFGMAYERAALVVGGGWVPALAGRNFFFPNKPDAFHTDCAAYARTSAALQLLLVGLAGPGALWWLFWAEVGWQLPVHQHVDNAVFGGSQLTATASLACNSRFQAALHAQEEPQSYAARSEGLTCCHEVAPTSVTFHVSTPSSTRRARCSSLTTHRLTRRAARRASAAASRRPQFTWRARPARPLVECTIFLVAARRISPVTTVRLALGCPPLLRGATEPLGFLPSVGTVGRAQSCPFFSLSTPRRRLRLALLLRQLPHRAPPT